MAFESDRERLELAFASSQLGLWDWNMGTSETVFNDRWAEIIGYSLEELQPTTIQTWVDFCHPDDLERSNAAIRAHVDGEADFYEVELRMRHRDGRWIWVHDRGKVVEWDKDGTPLRMVGTHDDITDRVTAQQHLREAGVVFENSLEGVLITDSSFKVTTVNPAFTSITGWSARGTRGRDLFFLFKSEMVAEQIDRLRQLARSPGGVRVELSLASADGTVIPVMFSANVVSSEQGTVDGFVCMITDLSLTKEAEQSRLEFVRSYDPTTGLPNRHRFLTELQHAINTSPQGQRRGAVVIINIDQFRRIVDAFGFPASEDLIKHVADNLRQFLEPDDVIARLAGDEFGIFMPDRSDPAEVEHFTQILIDALHDAGDLPGEGEVFLTASAGVALVTSESQSATNVVEEAVAGLHVAKEQASGSIGFAREKFGDEIREILALTAEMRQGWLGDEFRVEYQPTIDVRSNEIVGAEALMRWTSPKLGEIPPGRFIPLAEEAGLIDAFGTWILQQACLTGAELRASGMTDLRLSVNVSALQLLSDSFTQVVADALSESGFPGENLFLEVTEGTLMQVSEAVSAVFDEVRSMGVRFSIDDFGTGYSSFAYLARYPVDELKIDSSFVADLGTKAGAEAIVAAIIDMAHHLDIQVIAEGVESPEQLEVLRGLDCDAYQGFLASGAVPAEELKRSFA